MAGAVEAAFRSSAKTAGYATPDDIEFAFARFDDIFSRYPLDAETIARGLLVLARDAMGPPPGWTTRDLLGLDLAAKLRWTAGMVLQWIEKKQLRDELNQAVVTPLGAFAPDIICAHSLGSLACYDAFRRMVAANDAAAIDGRGLLTFGSQIANPAVQSVFGGRIGPLFIAGSGQGITQWFNLYNPNDHAFTCQLPGGDDRTHSLTTPFLHGLLNHDGDQYLGHPVTGSTALPHLLPVSTPGGTRSIAPAMIVRTVPQRRALLVGINDYPNPQWHLNGCVNDTYLVSAVLQECGYPAEGIRVLTDRRATRAALLERLDWLVDGARDGDERVFYYSGHGAQMPIYGPGGAPERIDETLVPADFDWSEAHAFRDKEFAAFYSQLPYGLRFITMFDCCHAGGMTRGSTRVRGIDPPDDVRHRAMKWDAKRQMWIPRDSTRTRRRLGVDTASRPRYSKAYDAARKTYGHLGPYMPVLIYAARQDELAAEYDHGSVAQGAFTFCFVKGLRAARKPPTFGALVKSVRGELAALGYQQNPEIVGPAVRTRERIPLGRK